MGWATVDGERAAAEVAGIEFGLESAETVLGARAWVAPIGSIALVLLEPSTEGRLAAFLARHGEALAALYLEADTSKPPPSGERAGCCPTTARGVRS
jgi:hypothetical protein